MPVSSLKIPCQVVRSLGESSDPNHLYGPISFAGCGGLSLKLVKAVFAHQKDEACAELNAY